MPPRTGRRPFLPFLTYVVIFHAAWIAWPYVVYPRLQALGDRTLQYAAVNLSIRLAFWIAPVLLFLRYVDHVEPLEYLKLRTNVGRGLAVAAALTVINVAGTVLRFGLIHPSLERVTWNSILGTSFLIGFIEEIPYRGFMLQQLAERMNFLLATFISSLLFAAIHVPGWLALHTLNTGAVITIFAFGVVMALAFRYSRSLWAPIVAHSANDCLSFVVFGL
jgi:membrane protease YdiL (CAAX protease family)